MKFGKLYAHVYYNALTDLKIKLLYMHDTETYNIVGIHNYHCAVEV